MKRARRIGSLIVTFALAALLAGCGGSREASTSPGSDTVARVRVQNQKNVGVEVFVVEGGQRFRLGRVDVAGEEVFAVPGSLVDGVATLQFLAQPTSGSNNASSFNERLDVFLGEEVRLVVL